MLNFLKLLVSPITDLGVQYMKNKQRKEEIKDAQHERSLDLIKEGKAQDAAWENKQIDQSGWRAEWLTLLLSIPLVGAFIPPMVPYIKKGFEVLAEMPEWYTIAVMAMLAAGFGIRKLADMRMKKPNG